MTEVEIPTLASEEVPKPQLATALAAFQAEIPRVVKDRKAVITPKADSGKAPYDYDYADLAAVIDAVMPELGKHGLAFLAKPTWLLINNSLTFVLVYKLMHESGEQEVGLWPLPPPDRAGPQALGGAITYARRYAFQAMTGVAPGPGEDDDAAEAEKGPRPDPVEAPIQRSQRGRILARLDQLGIQNDDEVRLAWVTGIRGIYTESLDQLSGFEASQLLDQLRPAGKQARNDVIKALADIGVTDKDAAMTWLTEVTGRNIVNTEALTIFEAGMAMREAGKQYREQVAAREQGEESQQGALDE